jgi:hypothetical protein
MEAVSKAGPAGAGGVVLCAERAEVQRRARIEARRMKGTEGTMSVRSIFWDGVVRRQPQISPLRCEMTKKKRGAR